MKKKLYSNKNSSINSRGQAALMDSIFFMAIVSAICTTLFFFTANYGNQLDKQVASFYSTDFAADTLKVVSYVSVLRDGLSVYGDPDIGYVNPELDYLLAMMKEDYADKKEFSCETRKSIASTFDAVLKPFSDSLDYAFYFVNRQQNNFLFMMLAVHECDPSNIEGCRCFGNYSDPTCSGRANDRPEIKLNYYYCTPQNNNILKDKVFPYAGKVDTVIGKLAFSDSNPNVTTPVVFDVELAMWISKSITSLKDISVQGNDFNCALIDFDRSCRTS